MKIYQNNSKSMLFVHLQGGIGNQLFIYFAAKHLEKKYNKKIIFVSKTESRLSHIGIDSGNDVIILPKLLHRILLGVFVKISKFKLISKLIYFNRDIGYEPVDQNVSTIRFISGYFQSYKYFDTYDKSKILSDQFLFRNQSYSNLYNEIDFKNSLAIHIRRGDYLLEQNNYFGLLSAEYYRIALTKIHDLKSYDSIFLFSDSKISDDFKNQLKINKKDNIIDMSFFPELDDLTTLAILTKFRTFIISNSTFSWWGACLGDTNKLVIAPSKWFKNQQDPSFLYPKNWLISESHWED
jgi:hypothetical protein